MRPFYLLFALMPALLFIRCAAVPMPAMVVPERGNSLEATVYAGNNGFGINALYATKRLTLFNAAIQRSPILTDSRAYEFGLGQVFKDSLSKTSMMMMVTAGYGKYSAHPYVLGERGQVFEVNSDALRLSLYGNWAFRSQKGGIIGRLSVYDGKSDQKRINEKPIEKHDFVSVGFEAIVYSVPGKRKHFLMGAGLGRATGKAESDGYGAEQDITPPLVFLFLGYRLAKNPKPAPLLLSQ